MSHANEPPMLLNHAAFVRGLVRQLVDPRQSDDVVQETWVAALKSPPDPQRNARPWLRRVATNAANQLYRREKRRSAHETAVAKEATPGPTSPAELAARTEALERVGRAVRALPDIYSEVILLRFYEDLGPEAIAQRTGTPLETIRSRLKRAMAQLRNQLDEDYQGRRHAWVALLSPLAFPAAGTAATAPIVTAPTLGIAALVLATVGAGWWWSTREPTPLSTSANPTSPSERGMDSTPDSPREAVADVVDRTAAPESSAPPPTSPVPTLRGSVVDPNGVPFAGATIELHRVKRVETPPTTGAIGLAEACASPRLSPIHTTSTDADGSFELATDGPPEDLYVLARAPGFGAVMQPWNARHAPLDASTFPALELELEAATAITGVVVDADGRPLGGTVVSAFNYGRWPLDRILRPVATTDANGRFSLPSAVEKGPSLLVAILGPRSLEAMVVEAGTPVELRVPRRCTLTLDVRSTSDMPLESAQVLVDMNGGFGKALGQTDVEGRAQLRVATGAIRAITVQHPSLGLVKWEDRVASDCTLRGAPELDSAQAERTLLIEPPMPLRGSVRDSHGQPIASARCDIVDLRSGLFLHVSRTESAADGSFELPGGFPLSTYLRVEADGYFQPQGPVELTLIAASRNRDAELVIELKRPAWIRGRVTNPDGDALAGVRVTASHDLSLAGAEPTFTDADGSYTLAVDRARGRVTVEAAATDTSAVSTPFVELSEAGVTEMPTLVLGATRPTTIRVLDAEGDALESAKVHLAVPGVDPTKPALMLQAVTDADGNATLADTPAVEALLWISHRDAPPLLRRIAVDDPFWVERSMQISLDPATSVSGVLVDDQGELQPGVIVSLRWDRDPPLADDLATLADALLWTSYLLVETDTEGRFHFMAAPAQRPLRVRVSIRDRTAEAEIIAPHPELRLTLTPNDPSTVDR